MKNEAIAQLQLPDLADTDEHPRLTLNGEGIHAGDCLQHYFPTVGMMLRWRLEKIRMDPDVGIFQRQVLEKFARLDCL